MAVAVTVWPVRLYASLYDAMWLNQSEIFDDARFGDAAGAAFFEMDVLADDRASDELDDLLAEEAAALEGAGPLYGPGGLFTNDAEGRALGAESTAFRREQIRGLRNRQLLRQRPMITDRPGPAPSPWWRELPSAYGFLGNRFPGVLNLPLPETTHGPSRYAATVGNLLEEHAAQFSKLAPFDTPLALDIAVQRSSTARRKDLDNLAHALMVPYERVYCAGARGTIASYRVYLSDQHPPGVRVLVMPDSRLETLEQALETTRNWLTRNPPHLRDD